MGFREAKFLKLLCGKREKKEKKKAKKRKDEDDEMPSSRPAAACMDNRSESFETLSAAAAAPSLTGEKSLRKSGFYYR